MAQIVKSQQVNWTGENPYIWLYHGNNGPIITIASFFRVIYSAAYGKGNVLFIFSDLQGDGFSGEEDFCGCLTDNPELAQWLKHHIVNGYTGFRDKPKEYAQMPIIVTPDFTVSGDPREMWTETIRSDSLEIELIWKNLNTPFYAEIPPTRWPYRLHTVLIPARSAEVRINGVQAIGQVRSMDFHGHTSTSCCLAFSETWLEAENNLE